MHYALKLFLLLWTLGLVSSTYAAQGRPEVARYTLMRDRTIIDRDLMAERWNSFFRFDMAVSSGTKSLVGDIKNGTESGSDADKTANVLNTLNKNINSERFVDADVTLGSPLPYIKIKKFRFLPSLFYNLNFGISVSMDNQASATDPRAQIYFKQETKMGLHSKLKWKEGEVYGISLYQQKRSDLYASRTSSVIATEQELFDFDDLSQDRVSYNMDFRFTKTKETYQYLVEFVDLKLLTSTNKETSYTTRPMLHARYEKYFTTSSWKIAPFAGIHHRSRYSLFDGFYVGGNIRYLKRIPIVLTAKLSSQFITLIPQVQYKYFHFAYSLKTPYINPQDDIWVAAIHSLTLNVPFP